MKPIIISEEELRKLANSVVDKLGPEIYKSIEVKTTEESISVIDRERLKVPAREIFRKLQDYREQYEEQCKDECQKENLAVFHIRDDKIWVKRSLCGLVYFLDRRVLFYDANIKPEDRDVVHCPKCEELR